MEPLIKALCAGIARRFHSVLSDKEHIIAYVLHPQFKLNFLPEDARLSTKRMVLAYVQGVSPDIPDSSGTERPVAMSVTTATTDEDDLYSYMNPAGSQAAGKPT